MYINQHFRRCLKHSISLKLGLVCCLIGFASQIEFPVEYSISTG
ncbi:hypothetical protein AtNW77_Chr3g0174191 [Arabidopsis thaliana]